MPEAASNANLLEFAKRLLAAFPGPAGPLFAENDPLDHFPGAQAPKTPITSASAVGEIR